MLLSLITIVLRSSATEKLRYPFNAYDLILYRKCSYYTFSQDTLSLPKFSLFHLDALLLFSP